MTREEAQAVLQDREFAPLIQKYIEEAEVMHGPTYWEHIVGVDALREDVLLYGRALLIEVPNAQE